MMFTYNIAKTADEAAFAKVCASIEKNLIGIEKEKPLYDVDGSQIQIYNTNNGKIKVVNDCDVDAVYVDSDVSLENVI